MNENLTKIQQKITENSVRIQLGNNKLRYCDKKCWVLENNDLNIAANEIIKLTKENEKLHNELNIKDEEYIELENQLHETQQLKEIALTMLAEERKQNLMMKREIAAYRDELEKSFKQIIELKSQLPEAPSTTTNK